MTSGFRKSDDGLCSMGELPLRLDSPMNRGPGPGLFKSGWIWPESKSRVKLYNVHDTNVMMSAKFLHTLELGVETR